MLTEKEKQIPQFIIDEMVSYLYTKGLIIPQADNKSVTHIPSVIYPTPIVKTFFDKMTFYQIAFNKILDKLSRDQAYLEEVLSPLAEKDEFIKKNLEISKKVAAFEHKQKIQLGIFRNDYVVDKNKKFIYQTNCTTSSAQFGFFSDGMKKFYQYFLNKYPEVFAKYTGKEKISIPTEKEDSIPVICNSMIEAIKLYFKEDYKNTIIVFVVPVTLKERQEFELRAMENLLWEQFQMTTKRMTLSEIEKNSTVNETSDILVNEKKVGLFYFRISSDSKDYPDEDSWKGREKIELSTAIKCPNINTFLTSLQVVQFQLTKADVLKKYITNEEMVNDLLRFFQTEHLLKELPPEQQKELLTKVNGNLDNYMIKCQSNGEMNICDGESILTLFPSADAPVSDDVANSIVIEKVQQLECETLVLSENKSNVLSLITEFSAYGVILSDENGSQFNKSVSFLVRAQEKSKIEGNISDNDCIFDLPCLIDMPINKEDAEPLKYSFE